MLRFQSNSLTIKVILPIGYLGSAVKFLLNQTVAGLSDSQRLMTILTSNIFGACVFKSFF